MHSEFAQSSLAGQRSAPIHSQLNPCPDFMLWGIWGLGRLTFWCDPINNCTFHPFGVISMSTTSTFLDLVLVWVWCKMYKRGINRQDQQYESLHLQMIPSALLLNPIPSTAILKIPYIPCAHWLWDLLGDCLWVGMTHCVVVDSWSSSDWLSIITRPLVMRVWILQNVCTAPSKMITVVNQRILTHSSKDEIQFVLTWKKY